MVIPAKAGTRPGFRSAQIGGLREPLLRGDDACRSVVYAPCPYARCGFLAVTAVDGGFQRLAHARGHGFQRGVHSRLTIVCQIA